MEKSQELAERARTLSQEPVSIQPDNEGRFPFSGKTSEEIKEEYHMKPVKITGIMDHAKEMKVL